ncbi:xanthine dehydrogenase family protein molybdopterin-binding subunit [Ramlibacter alkalitolerans]|uniref:Xanthine dehydrogenase family protein molybdopterin-binding subunit n=1 Tax=Ramlibacter alkalitolerans TaxID=2039631 RepID=A0ABS1JQM3_9BURK|nr:molybdopterin cofactor-binding domain-containing protein [Ramlibacter alkalitolerans]MBL0426560.1 xanthine dehydrogenase family protein molybdopterin-binding subunit [Ramlibacter alkalitolerans]
MSAPHEGTPPGELPTSLKANPRLSQWLAILREGRVEVRSGKVELGQGITTALAAIVAQELDVAPGRIEMVRASTAGAPNEGFTSGSLSVQDSGSALRQVCAEAREIYLHAAAQRLEVAVDDLQVRDGEIAVRGVPSLRTSYWELADPALLDREASGRARAKPPTQDAPEAPARLDLPDKVLGRPAFLHDLVLPGMLYARVAHPPSPAASLLDVDLAAVEALPGVVRVVRDGSFLGVIAQGDHEADRALRKLKAVARWSERESLPDMDALPAFLRSQPVETSVVDEKKPADPAPTPVRTFQASYARPYLAHASIGPSCGLARWDANGNVEVWTHAQGVYPMQRDLALLLRIPAQAITVSHVPGAGCYGHNGADDAAVDAALIARAVPGRAVQVRWTREDELCCSPFGAVMAVDLRAGVDAQGRIVAWEHEIWSNGHSMRPGRMPVPVFHAAPLLQQAFPPQVSINVPVATGAGAERNSIPEYGFATHRIVNHRLLTMPLRTSSLRSLGAHCNVFAAECFLDEIAAELGADPLDFRLRHLQDPRSRAVLEQVAAMAHWRQRAKTEGEGWGLGFARYKNNGAWCAAVAQVEVQQDIRVRRVWLAVDVGRVVHADGVKNQLEGGAIQTVSWVLKEAVQFDRTRVTSDRWGAYPILRFSEVPAVEIALLDRPQEKSLGAGEPTHGPLAAAIGNAVFDAVGVRVREMPLTWDRVQRAALAA